MKRQRKPKIIHYYARFGEHKSGVTESIATWLELSGPEAETELWMSSPPSDVVHRDVARVRASATRIRRLRHLGRRRVTQVPILPFWKISRGDIVYVHEGWVISNAITLLVARLRRATTVVMPHGVYEPDIEKRMCDTAGIRRRVEMIALRSARWVHVFYGSEVRHVEYVARRGVSAKALPNPIPLLDESDRWSPDLARDYFLWAGRFDIHHKGLDLLLQGWSGIEQPRPHLILVGPDFAGGKAQVARMIEELGLEGTVEVRDSADSKELRALARNAQGYVHPSRWESCSMLLNEMVGAGVPSIVHGVIHAAGPLEKAGVVLTYRGAEGLARAVDSIRSGWVPDSESDELRAFKAPMVQSSYQDWLRQISRKDGAL